MIEDMKRLVDSIKRGKGNFALGREGESYILAVGSIRACHAEGGFIVTIGMDRERAMQMRDQLDTLLREKQS